MIRPQPWHPEALALRAKGATVPQIAEAVEKSTTTVWRFLDPEYRARQIAKSAEIHDRKMAEDPTYRAAWSARNREHNRRSRIRKDARAEARETGRRYEDVCAGWDITP